MLNIGIVGSSFNVKKREIVLARKLGKIIAAHKTVRANICFDASSLPVEACKEIVKTSKKVMCFTSDKEEEKAAKKLEFSAINLNLPRLSRELVFVRKVDALLVCGGGSGTLMEVTFAYQLGKSVFLLSGIKSSVEPFKNKFLDRRKRVKVTAINLKDLDKVFLGLSKKPSSLLLAG